MLAGASLSFPCNVAAVGNTSVGATLVTRAGVEELAVVEPTEPAPLTVIVSVVWVPGVGPTTTSPVFPTADTVVGPAFGPEVGTRISNVTEASLPAVAGIGPSMATMLLTWSITETEIGLVPLGVTSRAVAESIIAPGPRSTRISSSSPVRRLVFATSTSTFTLRYVTVPIVSAGAVCGVGIVVSTLRVLCGRRDVTTGGLSAVTFEDKTPELEVSTAGLMFIADAGVSMTLKEYVVSKL
jgi:hypothetical protein